VGKASRNRRRAAAVKARRTRSGSPVWYAATGAIIVIGVIAIALSRGSNAQVAPFANQDHWHAALGVNVCGTWLPNAPAFEFRGGPNVGSGVRAGLHSHDDGLMHIHPYSSDEAGKNATVGTFWDYGGWKLGENSFTAWDGVEHKNGGKCKGKTAEVRWQVNGKEKSGNPAGYRPQQSDVVVIAFLPQGQKIGTPPQAASLANPSDLPPSAQPGTTVPGETTAPGATTAPAATTAPGATETTVPSSTAAPGTSAPAETTTPSSAAATTAAP
jgi:hypothetical protein